MKGGPQARVSSPVLLRSTLMTSAPRSARIWPAHGPARMRASSRTRRPVNGPGIGPLLLQTVRQVAAQTRFLWPAGAALSIARNHKHLRRFVDCGGHAYLVSYRSDRF